MVHPSADAAAIAAAKLAVSFCETTIKVGRINREERRAAYMDAYRYFLDEIASIRPMPKPDFIE